MFAKSLSDVLELLRGPAFLVGAGGEILGANERAYPWAGANEDGLVGRSLTRIVADLPEQVDAFLEKCASGGQKIAATLTPRGTGGACQVEGVAVRDSTSSGEERQRLVVVHVVSSAQQDEVVAVLREQVRHGEEFLDRLAHDLRNPVAAIRGAVDLLRAATTAEDVVWARETMERQLRQLVRQLDDLTDLTRITRGTLALNRQRVDGGAAARAAAAAVRPMLEERGARLTLVSGPDDLSLSADPARLEQMLVGLVAHVAGSARQGDGVRLAVARERDAIVFRASEQRNGQPASMPASSSQPPHPHPHPSPSPGRERGVAPVLVRKLAALHGGSASEPGQGGEFTIRLPAASADSDVAARPRTAAAPATGARILVVDDNVDTARGTARLLQLEGHDVRVAHDGYEALAIALEHRPQFILLDISLPGMDGYEVARQLRGDPRYGELTIIAVSGYSADDIRPPHETGIDHHLVKPVDYDALRAILAVRT